MGDSYSRYIFVFVQ